MIDKLVAVLRAAKLDPTAEEIADALWLAAVAPPMKGTVGAEAQTPSQTSEDRPSGGTKTETASRHHEPASRKETNHESGAPSGALHQAMGHAPSITPSKRGVAIASPMASALPGALDIARALRPLKRRVPSKTHFELDEDATAQGIAERAAQPVVLRPAQTRWLNLMLLVDESPSMAIWQQTVRELRTLLEGHGAFGHVSSRGFVAEGPDEPHLFVRTGQSMRVLEPSELVDPTGRQLLLIVSDCVAEGWYDGRMAALLGTWAARGPVGLLHVLPPRLWHRSALGAATPVRLRALLPAVANTRLVVEKDDWWSEEDVPRGTPIPLPVFPIERTSIESWATMIAGGAGEGVGGVALRTRGEAGSEYEPIAVDEELDARKIMAHFRATASLKAQKLATHFASAHYLSLPVMRLIRRAMVVDATLGHLAEVFLGGLLRHDGGTSDDPEYARYRFADGVRELLLDSADERSIIDVLYAVSDYATAHLGHKTSFRALVADPTGGGSEVVPETEAPFARIGADILRRLGGRFEELADRFSARLPSAPSSRVQRFDGAPGGGDVGLDEKLVELAREYEAIRAHSPSGPPRTAQLERLFDEMRIRAVDQQLRAALAIDVFRRNTEGMRIAALAILRADPDPSGFEVVLGAIADPKANFEQYHALLVTLRLLPRLSLAQKNEVRNAILHQRSGAPDTRIKPESDRWLLSEQILQELDAPHQIVIVLDLENAELPLNAIDAILPRKRSHRTVLRVAEHGVGRPAAHGIGDWRIWREAIERIVEIIRSSIAAEGPPTLLYVVGRAPLPVLVHLGFVLPRQVQITMYDAPRLDAGVLHVDPTILLDPADTDGSRTSVHSLGAANERGRVVVFVGADRDLSVDGIRAFLATRSESLSDVVEVRFDEANASLGPAVRSALAVIQIEDGLGKAAERGSRLALVVDGPPALAFLAGRALDMRHFRDICVPLAGEQRLVSAFEYDAPVSDDDAEADDAVAVLGRYWMLGIEVAEAMAEWAQCHDHVPGFRDMRSTLWAVHARVASALERMPKTPVAKRACGQEIESAHVDYVATQLTHIVELESWILRHEVELKKAMRRQPLAEAFTRIRDPRPWPAYGYERIMGVESTKRLFQCGPHDNVAWINKVAARLGLGPDKLGGGPLRVRSTQRIIAPIVPSHSIEASAPATASTEGRPRRVTSKARAKKRLDGTKREKPPSRPAERRKALRGARHFRFHADYETSERAGAGGMFQVVTIEDDMNRDVTAILGMDNGMHYPDAKALARDIARNLGVGVDDFELEEV